MLLDRIKQYLDIKGISVSAFERSIGMSNASFGKSLKKGGAIGTDKLENILSVYPDISVEWLFSGKGSMLKDGKDNSEPTITTNPQEGVPYYDVDFIGGFCEVYNCQTIPQNYIKIQGFERADCWCNVSGHSMEPKINNGDIIALRSCYVEDIQYGEIYAVVTDSIRTIKILRKSRKPNMLRFIPINTEEFDEQEYPISDILHIFKVIGSIRKFF
jgi:phage repressor protein C with HTH and peptisase S24 domain